MAERTAAEFLAEKMRTAWSESVRQPCGQTIAARLDDVAARLAEDPAITVRADMVVERFIVEFHCTDWYNQKPLSADEIHRNLTTSSHFVESARHRIIVRPYPEDPDA